MNIKLKAIAKSRSTFAAFLSLVYEESKMLLRPRYVDQLTSHKWSWLTFKPVIMRRHSSCFVFEYLVRFLTETPTPPLFSIHFQTWGMVSVLDKVLWGKHFNQFVYPFILIANLVHIWHLVITEISCLDRIKYSGKMENVICKWT